MSKEDVEIYNVEKHYSCSYGARFSGEDDMVWQKETSHRKVRML